MSRKLGVCKIDEKNKKKRVKEKKISHICTCGLFQNLQLVTFFLLYFYFQRKMLKAKTQACLSRENGEGKNIQTVRFVRKREIEYFVYNVGGVGPVKNKFNFPKANFAGEDTKSNILQGIPLNKLNSLELRGLVTCQTNLRASLWKLLINVRLYVASCF